MSPRVAALYLSMAGIFVLAGCKPAATPPDILATQRAAIDRAKAVEGQLKQDLEQRMKPVDGDKQ